MEHRRLGRTDLNVSLICLGTMTWGQQNTEADGHAQMDYALDKGINFFDTAESYAALVFTIVAINAWNRLAIANHAAPGIYTPKPG